MREALDSGLQGVRGLLLEEIAIPSPWDRLLEDMLGRLQHALWTEDRGTAAQLDQAAFDLFFPVDDGAAQLAPIAGATPLRARLAGDDARLDALCARLGAVYTVETAAEARQLAEQHPRALFLSADGELHGFSTIQWLESESGGRRCLTLFSGDTVVDHRCWGQKALQRAFVWNVFRMKLTRPRARVFWFLITKGYKTYLLMQRNFPCHPSRLRAFPPDMKRLLDEVARRKFGDGYDAGAGIVRFEECQGKVKGAFEDLGESERDDPDIAFFLEANPGFREGDELCCLTEIGFRELAGVIGKYFIKKPLGRLFSRSR